MDRTIPMKTFCLLTYYSHCSIDLINLSIALKSVLYGEARIFDNFRSCRSWRFILSTKRSFAEFAGIKWIPPLWGLRWQVFYIWHCLTNPISIKLPNPENVRLCRLCNQNLDPRRTTNALHHLRIQICRDFLNASSRNRKLLEDWKVGWKGLPFKFYVLHDAIALIRCVFLLKLYILFPPKCYRKDLRSFCWPNCANSANSLPKLLLFYTFCPFICIYLIYKNIDMYLIMYLCLRWPDFNVSKSLRCLI